MSQDVIDRVVELTNLERSKAGLSPLTVNAQLAAAAQGQSENMALQDFVSHTGLDGSQPWDRVSATGYQWFAVGENLFAGGTSPEEVVAGWMSSPGHRANILNPDLQEIGVGYYFLLNDTGSLNYHYYWTQVFATPAAGTSSNPAPPPQQKTLQDSPDEGSNLLLGTAGSDPIAGLGGDDTINGLAGDDLLNGNAGSDSVSGDQGDDIVFGGQGDDILLGGAGDDLSNGNKGRDRVEGGDGNDTLYGGKDSDTLLGDAGSDFLCGDMGADSLIGGAGADVYALGADAADIIYFNTAEDLLVLPSGLSFQDLSFIQGFDEYVPDSQVETQIVSTATGQLLAVLPGVEASALQQGNFAGL